MSYSELIANSNMAFGGNQFLLNPNRQKVISVIYIGHAIITSLLYPPHVKI